MCAAACGVSVTQPISGGVGGSDGAAGPDAAGIDLSLGLAAHWKLDEGSATEAVVDSSGHGHNGTPINEPAPSSSVPPVRFPNPSSRAFDGANQYVLVGNSDDL